MSTGWVIFVYFVVRCLFCDGWFLVDIYVCYKDLHILYPLPYFHPHASTPELLVSDLLVFPSRPLATAHESKYSYLRPLFLPHKVDDQMYHFSAAHWEDYPSHFHSGPLSNVVECNHHPFSAFPHTLSKSVTFLLQLFAWEPSPMCLQVQALVGHWYNSYGWHGDPGYLLMQLTCVLWSCLSPILDVTFPCCYGLMLSLSYFMTWQFRKNPTHNV